MSSSSATKLSLKVMTNKHRTKVLFAEADSDFINVLLSFLTLPLGEVARVLQKHNGEEAPAIESMGSLYKGLSDLDIAHFCMPGAKEMLLNPQSWFQAENRKVALDITDSPPKQYFFCEDEECPKSREVNISMYSDIATCDCGKPINRGLLHHGSVDDGAFIINPSSFIITDDLFVAPMTGIIQTLNNLGGTDTQGGEMEIVSFGINEIRDLLKHSLTSATPLSDMIIGKTQSRYAAAKLELHNILNNEANTKKIALKVCLQKSTNRFLFAVATDEFVDLLFSFLTVPLGGVEFLLGGNTGLRNIDNLYTSVSNAINDKYFTTPDIKNSLINPKVAHGYISKNQFLPLNQQGPPKTYTCKPGLTISFFMRHCHESSFCEKYGTLVSSFKLSKELYVKKQTICIITDDLTMSHSLATSMSIINALEIPLSDVKEMELHVGVKEALDILKASLTSKTVLTDALIKPMLNRLPKVECDLKQEP